jgi:outer membrane protein OmpA-like peptidoglycan-associated protein
MKEEILVCQCGDPSHQLVLGYDNDPDFPCVYVSVHLVPETSFFKRLWIGLKYIFSRQRSIYGDFDEIILKPEDAEKLQEAVNLLKGNELYQQEIIIPLNLEPNQYKS